MILSQRVCSKIISDQSSPKMKCHLLRSNVKMVETCIRLLCIWLILIQQPNPLLLCIVIAQALVPIADKHTVHLTLLAHSLHWGVLLNFLRRGAAHVTSHNTATCGNSGTANSPHSWMLKAPWQHTSWAYVVSSFRRVNYNKTCPCL